MQDEYRDLLRRALNDKGWTYAELARRVGVTRGAVQKWVLGQGKPDKKYVPKLAQLLGRPQMELWRFYADDEGDLPTWETLRLADVLTIPPGTSAVGLSIALTQLETVFPAMCLSATAAFDAVVSATADRERKDWQQAIVDQMNAGLTQARLDSLQELANPAPDGEPEPRVPPNDKLTKR